MATNRETKSGGGDWNNSEAGNKLGKAIFYVTVALGLWFFYWLNGIQCPC